MTSPGETARPPPPRGAQRNRPRGGGGGGGPAVTVTQARTDRFDRRLLPPMMLGAILNPINSSIIAVALVPIGAALGAPASQTVWLVSALYLATSIGQPLAGRLVDSIGPRRMFLIGASLTGLAGVVGTVAPSLGVLIVARVVLGFGTCAGYPAAMYLIRSEARRTGMASPAGVLTALVGDHSDDRGHRPDARRAADLRRRLAGHLRDQHPARAWLPGPGWARATPDRPHRP